MKVINRVFTHDIFPGFFFTVKYLSGKRLIYFYDIDTGKVYDFAGCDVTSKRLIKALDAFRKEEERQRMGKYIITEFEKLKNSSRWS